MGENNFALSQPHEAINAQKLTHLWQLWGKIGNNLRNAQTLTLALEMIIMNPETPLNTPHTNSPRRTGLNGAFDVHYGRVEHLVEV